VTGFDDVTVGAIAHPTELLASTISCEQVHLLFHADPKRASVVVGTPGDPVLVNRRPFYEALTGRLGYGRMLHYQRPVTQVISGTVLVVDAETSLEAAALELLASEAASTDDILVRLDTGWATAPAAGMYRHMAERHAERAADLARSEERFRLLVEHAVDIIAILDEDGRLRYRSRAVEGVAEGAVGEDVFGNLHPDDAAEVSVVFQRGLRNPGTTFRGEFRLLDTSGRPHLFEYNARNCLDDPAIAGVVVNFREITERRALEDQLVHHAFHDPLTGLPNRELLFQRADYALQRLDRVPGRVAALYLDLDGFKGFNDELGHDFGDAIIIAIAERLRQNIRRGDTLARIGGDEFVVLADGCTDEEATELGGRLVEAIAQPVAVWDQLVTLSGSVGLAVSTSPTSVAALLQQADSAMYAAKAGGRNRMERFDPAAHESRLRRTRISADLPGALTRGELHLEYQTIVEASSRAAVGVEALLRWSHPVLGAVPPLEFVTVAEQRGLIERIGAWVLDRACHQLAAWDADGPSPRYLSVNVSAPQLDEPGFAAQVAATLTRAGIEPTRLQLEVTESGLATDRPERIETLRALRDIGVAVAIDDFGTGYSSLSYLSHLPVDVVKLDQMFVSDLDRSPDADILLRSIVELAHSLGHRVTAEGVETDEQSRALRAMGCDALQGFLFSRPEPPAQVARRFRASLAPRPSVG
jgi:diguanylate cyclase (GGDEF)-like protein/PAS domain S-box-containing protein